jgi:hypothetical protein
MPGVSCPLVRAATPSACLQRCVSMRSGSASFTRRLRSLRPLNVNCAVTVARNVGIATRDPGPQSLPVPARGKRAAERAAPAAERK